MLTTAFALYLLSTSITSSQILLYNTEENPLTDRFDCLYHTQQNTAHEIPYCQRPDGQISSIRTHTQCENDGKKRSFRDLLDEDIQPSEVLQWSSSVEMADLYASIYYNRSFFNDDHHHHQTFICQCTQMGTFGKFCEYQLTHNATHFTRAITAQFHQKKLNDSWDTQKYGLILCYQTLSCDSSPLCLDWREICDGFQRCANGIDEHNCDTLEFNECEENEFRCNNGMCIAEEFWFDGELNIVSSSLLFIQLLIVIGEPDCMDWSDEYYFNDGEHCSFTANTIECDEHLCLHGWYSCGDGECVPWYTRMAFQRIIKAEKDCFSKRNLNHMCEMSPHRRSWTLENGLCWPDADYDDPRYSHWNITQLSNLTSDQRCGYLFRCLASDNFEHHCPCHHLNCKQIIIDHCPQRISYPPAGLITPNIQIVYSSRDYERNTNFDFFLLGGGLRCPGYFSQMTEYVPYPISLAVLITSFIQQFLCDWRDPTVVDRDYSSPLQFDKFCWNQSSTFNARPYAVNPDICAREGQCISQYRIRDGLFDCLFGGDENKILTRSYCTGNAGRHRFQCYNDQRKCLTAFFLGTGTSECSNDYDESPYGNGLPLGHESSCQKDRPADCQQVKEYIQQSSTTNKTQPDSLNPSPTQQHGNRIPFRSHCDSWWDADSAWDEQSSSCQQWICRSDQYRCRTGQCIEFSWLCDGEWDCTDASDEEAVFFTQPWSPHNSRLTHFSQQVNRCRRRYSRLPFSTVCNGSFELGCLRSGVLSPLNITLNRPCINLTQIGDGKQDCYNANDEKNTFAATSYIGGMWGFHFRCGARHQTYINACKRDVEENCTDLVCSKYQDTSGSCSETNDFICFTNHECKKNARCNGTFDCPHGEDEYWCPSTSLINQVYYRDDKSQFLRQQILDVSSILYPQNASSILTDQQVSTSIVLTPTDPQWTNHSFICNRGISVLQKNDIRCLCPPSYYGSRCQFFTDRLTVIVHLNRTTQHHSLSNITLKIQVHFLFNNNTLIDQHDFLLVPILEATTTIKHQFYLLYSRSTSMIEHKRNRYFNRTDLIHYHPYTLHFILFALNNNNIRPEEVGAWHYPIYFDHLPAFRLATVLKFPSSSWDPCRVNPCNENSTCLRIFNRNTSYCSCRSGYYGSDCSVYEPLCHTHCASNAFCQPNSLQGTKPSCLCQLDHFGSRCHLKYDACHQKPCLNGGTCSLTYDRSGEQPFICLCSNRFYGSQCQREMASVYVQLNLTTTFSVRATVLQFYDILLPSLTLQLIHQKVQPDLPSIITFYRAGRRAPLLGLLKIYDLSLTAQYFVIYVLNQSLINITSSPQHCLHASSWVSKGHFHFHSIHILLFASLHFFLF
jgi:hypothetical protein